MISVTVRQLEVFKSVVDRGSFSGAAASLNISQPSVSMHIRALEARVSQRVFERHRGRSPTLTNVGQRVYQYATEMLEQSDRTSVEIQSLLSARDNVLSITAQRFIANHLLSKPLADFAHINPGIEIIANIGALERTIENIQHRDVDLSLFLARGPVKGVFSEVIGHQALVFVAAPDHPLACKKNLRASDLAVFPFIGPVKGSQYGRLLQSVFEEIGLTSYTTLIQSQHTLIRKELIQSGDGLSCALRFGIREDVAQGHLIVLDVATSPFLLEVRIGSVPDRQISQASRKFVAYLKGLAAKGAFNG